MINYVITVFFQAFGYLLQKLDIMYIDTYALNTISWFDFMIWSSVVLLLLGFVGKTASKVKGHD